MHVCLPFAEFKGCYLIWASANPFVGGAVKCPYIDHCSANLLPKTARRTCNIALAKLQPVWIWQALLRARAKEPNILVSDELSTGHIVSMWSRDMVIMEAG